MAKLTSEVVSDMMTKYESGVSANKLAALYGVHISTVLRAIKATTWAHVADDPEKFRDLTKIGNAGMRQHRAKLTNPDIMAIRERYMAGEAQHIIASDLGITQSVVSLIVQGKAWKHITGGRAVNRLRKPLPLRGERCPWARFTNEDIRLMRSLYEQGESQTVIGKKLGVDHGVVWAIVHRKIWMHVA